MEPRISEGLWTDAVSASVHYQQFEGKAQETAEKVNDTYLKTMRQTDGVQSYGQMVDLLIAWQLQTEN